MRYDLIFQPYDCAPVNLSSRSALLPKGDALQSDADGIDGVPVGAPAPWGRQGGASDVN